MHLFVLLLLLKVLGLVKVNDVGLVNVHGMVLVKVNQTGLVKVVEGPPH